MIGGFQGGPASPPAGVLPLGPARSGGGPLRIGVLVSATGANLSTLISMERAEPDRFQVALVASHGERAKALDVARAHGVETWTGDFDARCGIASRATGPAARADYRRRARSWHDGLSARMAAWEAEHGELDLIVLAYHRWIEGDLLDRYHGRMVNQHPGDLSVLDPDGHRVLIGNDPVTAAIALGHSATRTSCFLVDASPDGGAVLCQGPPLVLPRGSTPPDSRAHELEQKRVSDRPALEWTVRAFASASLALSDRTHPDGSRVVRVNGTDTALGGRRLTAGA